jgi:hypothetical protein
MFFSGFIVGVSGLPLILITPDLWFLYVFRCFLLPVVWYCLNMYLPSKILCWNRDVIEENLRYGISM